MPGQPVKVRATRFNHRRVPSKKVVMDQCRGRGDLQLFLVSSCVGGTHRHFAKIDVRISMGAGKSLHGHVAVNVLRGDLLHHSEVIRLT